jgi:FkbM family methyltransferase
MMTADTIELGPPDARYRIYDPGGGGRVAKILRTGTPYEVDVVADMVSLDAAGVAVDVGANIGNHTLWLAAVCGLRVEAFEPIRHAKLAANVALNNLQDQVGIHRHALGDTPGSATRLAGNRLDVGTGDITIRTLDAFAFTGVSILKIDVEGMETDVVAGGLETIADSRPVIYAEAWNDDYLAAVGRLLEPLGYRHARAFRWHQNRWDP